MSGFTKDTDSPSKIQSSGEDRLAALEGHIVELWKENQSLQSRIRTLEVRLASAEDTLINLSPPNLGMQTHKSFAFFPKLSPELRRMIWIFARPAPSVLKIFEKKDEKVYYTTAKVPALLHACQESRQIAKIWYELSFPGNYYMTQSSRIYFDSSSDFVYVPRYVPQQYGEDKSNPTRLNAKPWSLRVTKPRKIMNVIHEAQEMCEPFYELLYWLSSAEKALLVLEGDGMLQASAELSEFTLTADPFPWQRTRTVQQAYIDTSKKSMPNCSENWNLTSIQRARFGAVRRDC